MTKPRTPMIFPFDHLDVLDVRCRLRARGPATLPPFLGSTLRGAFGHALKNAACAWDPDLCADGCRFEGCGYGRLFEAASPASESSKGRHEDLPSPYVLVAPPLRERATRLERGGELEFSVVLFGRGIEQVGFVASALAGIGRAGLGAERTPFDTADLSVGDIVDLASGIDRRRTDIGDVRAVTLRISTPVRIRLGGDLQTRLTFPVLVKNLARRLALMTTAHGRRPLDPEKSFPPAEAETVRAARDALRWHDWERWSNRQRQKMKLGGLVGDIAFEGDALAEFLPLLLAGEILHVGGSTTFGLGRYRVESERDEKP